MKKSIINRFVICCLLVFAVAVLQVGVFAATEDEYVGASANDAHQQASGGAVDITDTQLKLGSTEYSAFRFPSVGVPYHSTVSSAYIYFYSSTAGCGIGGNINVTIKAELSTTSAAFAATTNNISGRTWTSTGNVTWPTIDWGYAHVHNANTQTSDLTGLVNQVKSQTNWTSGMPMTFLFQGASDGRCVAAYDDAAGAYDAQLHIVYTPETNLASGKTTTVTSIQGAGQAASYAVDANYGTRWGTAYSTDPDPDSGWIYVDLASNYYVDEVFIDWETAAAAEYYIQIATSSSNTDDGWTNLANITDGTSNENRNIQFTAGYGRYVRMRGISRTTGYGYSIYEFEVYEGSNTAPSNVSLSASTVDENEASGTVVGTFSSTDVNYNETHTYSLVTGTGSTDNASFTVDGTSLKTAASFDYETKSSYAIRVQTSDCGSSTYQKAFTVTVNDVNEAPTDISISPGDVNENKNPGTTVGEFSTTDPDGGQTHTYSLVTGTGGADNASFTISGTSLNTAASFDYETKASYAIRVRTTDNGSGSLTFEEALTITVNDVLEGNAPTDIALSPSSVDDGKPIGTVVGVFSTTDLDVEDHHTYSLVTGTGSTDNASFTIDSGCLVAAEVFDYDTKSSYAIRVRTTDNGTPNLTYEEAFTITVYHEDYIDWGFSQNVLINTSETGAYVSGDVISFPLLIRLDPGNFDGFANTLDNGDDIRFANSYGTHLSYDIEKWKDNESDNDTAAIWVLVDTVFGDNSSQYISMYWGNDAATGRSIPADVFRVSKGFGGLWHMDSTVAGATGTEGVYLDATGNQNHGDDYVSATGQTGVIGLGHEFDGSDDYMDVPAASSLGFSGDATISGWFKLDATFNSSSENSQILVEKYRDVDSNLVIALAGTDYDYTSVADGSLVFKIEHRVTDKYRFVWTTQTTWAADTWYYFTVLLDADKSSDNKVYINGVDVTQ